MQDIPQYRDRSANLPQQRTLIRARVR